MTQEKIVELKVKTDNTGKITSIIPSDYGVNLESLKEVSPIRNSKLGHQSTSAIFEIIGCPTCPLLEQRANELGIGPKPETIKCTNREYNSMLLSPATTDGDDRQFPNPHEIIVDNNSSAIIFTCPLLISIRQENIPQGEAKLPCQQRVSFNSQDYPFLFKPSK